MSVVTIPFPRNFQGYSQDSRRTPFVSSSSPAIPITNTRFTEPFLSGPSPLGGRAPMVPSALPPGYRYMAAQQRLKPPGVTAGSNFESPTRPRGGVPNRTGSQQLSSNYRCDITLPSQMIPPAQVAGQLRRKIFPPVLGPEPSIAIATGFSAGSSKVLLQSLNGFGESPPCLEPCKQVPEGELFFEAGKSPSPSEQQQQAWQRPSQQIQVSRVPISTSILNGTPVLTSLSPARGTNGDVRQVAVERLYQLLAVPQKPLRGNAYHTVSAMVPTAEDSTKPKLEGERGTLTLAEADVRGLLNPRGGESSPGASSSVGSIGSGSGNEGGNGGLQISVPASSGLLGSPAETGEMSPSAAASNSGRRVFCIGSRCDHIESWKRLRAKKGTAYYICRQCTAKWRIISTTAANPMDILALAQGLPVTECSATLARVPLNSTDSALLPPGSTALSSSTAMVESSPIRFVMSEDGESDENISPEQGTTPLLDLGGGLLLSTITSSSILPTSSEPGLLLFKDDVVNAAAEHFFSRFEELYLATTTTTTTADESEWSDSLLSSTPKSETFPFFSPEELLQPLKGSVYTQAFVDTVISSSPAASFASLDPTTVATTSPA